MLREMRTELSRQIGEWYREHGYRGDVAREQAPIVTWNGNDYSIGYYGGIQHVGPDGVFQYCSDVTAVELMQWLLREVDNEV